MAGVTMEYVVGALLGMAVLIGCLLFRRRSRLQEQRVGFYCVTRKAADGSEVRFQLRARPPYTDHPLP